MHTKYLTGIYISTKAVYRIHFKVQSQNQVIKAHVYTVYYVHVINGFTDILEKGWTQWHQRQADWSKSITLYG